MVDLTKKVTNNKVVRFLRKNKSKIIKGTLLVTAVAAGVLATKYLQLKDTTNKVLELTTSIPEESTDVVAMVEDVIQSNN